MNAIDCCGYGNNVNEILYIFENGTVVLTWARIERVLSLPLSLVQFQLVDESSLRRVCAESAGLFVCARVYACVCVFARARVCVCVFVCV